MMTTITGTLHNADGTVANGTACVSWIAFQIHGVTIVSGQKIVTIVDGQFSVELYPNITAFPKGIYYTVRMELDSGAVYDEYWIVPELPAVRIEQVRSSFPLEPGMAINPSQIAGSGAEPGMILAWNGSYWEGSYVKVDNVSPNWIRVITGSSGNDFNIAGSPVMLGQELTINIPSASATARGLVTTGTQTFGGDKTFANNVGIAGTLGVQGSVSVGGGLNVAGSITGPTITDIYSQIGSVEAGAVPNTRRINTTAPLGGGGPLSTDLTLTADISAIQTPWKQDIEGANFDLNNIKTARMKQLEILYQTDINWWDQSTRVWSEAGVGTRYDGYSHRFDVGESRTLAMRITANGNVGIGVDPAYKLDVAGEARIVDGIRLGADAGTQLVRTATPETYLSHSGAGPLNIYTSASGIKFYTANTERVYINPSGNVGIGVADPQYKLDVAGQTQITTTRTSIAGSQSSLILKTTASSTAGGPGIYFIADGQDALQLTSRGGALRNEAFDGNSFRNFMAAEIWSVSGGIKFPDGTVQVTALTKAQAQTPWVNNIDAAGHKLGGLSANTTASQYYNAAVWIDEAGGNSSPRIGFIWQDHGAGQIGFDGIAVRTYDYAGTAYVPFAAAQIESKSGGFRFPDGTVQLTALTKAQAQSPWLSDIDAAGYSLIALYKLGINSGFIEWRNNGGSRLGYLGFSETNVPLTLENGADFTVNGGNVGIGTADPQYKLDVAGTARITGNAYIQNASDSGGQLSIGQSGGNGGYAYLYLNRKGSGGYPAAIVFQNAGVDKATIFNPDDDSLRFATGAGTWMHISGGGNIGISNNNPQYKLDITGDINITGLYRVNGVPISTGGGGIAQTPWLSNIDADGYNLTDLGILIFRSQGGTGAPAHMYTYAGNLEFWTGNASRIFIKESGNVGIGTADPQYKLDVAGDIRCATLFPTGDIHFAGGKGLAYHAPAGGLRWQLCTLGAESGGNTGTDLLLGRYDDSAAYAGSPIFIRRSSGFVGINSSGNPQYSLDISGDCNLSSGSVYRINGVPLAASNIGAVPATTQVIAGTGLTGGGALSGNVTLSVGTVPIANLAAGDYSGKVTSGSYSISITGSAGSVAWSVVTGKPAWNSDPSTFIGGALVLAWKNFGLNHVIFDASQSTAPSGDAVNNTNATNPWAASYPTLMGWNGGQTYGVRVDVCRYADSAGSATSAGNANTVGGLAPATNATYPSASQLIINSSNNFVYTNNVAVSGYLDTPGIHYPRGQEDLTPSWFLYQSGDPWVRRGSWAHLNNSISPHWGNIQGRPGNFVYNDGGTYGIHISGTAQNANALGTLGLAGDAVTPGAQQVLRSSVNGFAYLPQTQFGPYGSGGGYCQWLDKAGAVGMVADMDTNGIFRLWRGASIIYLSFNPGANITQLRIAGVTKTLTVDGSGFVKAA